MSSICRLDFQSFSQVLSHEFEEGVEVVLSSRLELSGSLNSRGSFWLRHWALKSQRNSAGGASRYGLAHSLTAGLDDLGQVRAMQVQPSAQVLRKVGTGLLDFETHEWTKHVQFAAEEKKKDLSTQDCSKSTHPISIITEAKQVVVILTPCLQR